MCELQLEELLEREELQLKPQAKLEDGVINVNITFIDDGRVLDTPEELSHAFEHAIQTEIALKGFDYIAVINLYRSKDGEIEDLSDEEDEEMFACEICDGLVKESDNECPHCGAIFEDEEDDEPEPPRRGPPRRAPPSGPSRGGPPGGPSRGGPPKGPSKSPPSSPKPSGPSGGPPKSPGRSQPSGGPPKGPGRSPPSGGPPKGPGRSPPSGGPPKGPRRGPPR